MIKIQIKTEEVKVFALATPVVVLSVVTLVVESSFSSADDVGELVVAILLFNHILIE